MTNRLSKHFTLMEAMKSQTGERLGLDNTPPNEIIPRLIFVAETILEPIRAHYGVPFSPNSWYRSPALNRAIGGAPSSQHVKGEAVDIEVPGVPNIDLAKWVKAHLKFDQIILECWNGVDPASGWVHVSAKDGPMRGQVLTYSKGKYSKGLPA